MVNQDSPGIMAMSNPHITEPSQPPAAASPAGASAAAQPEHTVDFPRDEEALDAGLLAAFDDDSGPPLPAGGSVLQALEAAAPGSVRRVHLRTPDDEPPTPVNLPTSDEMPRPQDFPDRYQLVGEIARGGMGAIFKGRDVNLGRDIAVKMMLETHKGRTEMLQRFVEEAQIGGQLQHPGIVPVYELSHTGDCRPYFTMKLVKGQTLTVLLKQRTGPQHDLPRFLSIFEQVCRTVAYAHARGVIHRDLKPSNIMVGSFGEVQVMDWGLAKVLKRGDEPPPEEATVICTARSHEPNLSNSTPAPGSQTAAGSILGTPAYMAPEQARGEVESLDERCDVFGLGGILCQILTGHAPYSGVGRPEQREQARQAELSASLARFDACGTDAALSTLAKDCLQADKDDRPRNAGAVAQTMTAYLESVQARLKHTELDRAAAQARADEEQRRRQAEQARAVAEEARADEEQRRCQAEQARAHTERQRRRLTVALATVLVLLMAGAGTAGWWYQHDQLEQAEQWQQREAKESTRKLAETARKAREAARKDYLNKEVTAALQKGRDGLKELHQALGRWLPDPKHPLSASVLLSDLKQWETRVQAARVLYQQAKKLAAGDPESLTPAQKARLDQLGRQFTQAEAHYRIAQQLDAIRLEAWTTRVEGRFSTALAGPKYEKLFLEKLKLDLRNGPLSPLAKQVKGSALRYVLVAALDHWADVSSDPELLGRLLEVTRAVDSDPWRNQVRNVQTWQDRGQLQQLAKVVQPQEQTPQILVLLARRLEGQGRKKDAAALLRAALVHYPADFWLNFQLGLLADDSGEKAGCYRAALAIRAGCPNTHNNLATALYAKQDLDGAIQEYKKAIELDPKYAPPHNGLGAVLRARSNAKEAIEEYKKAIELDPKYASPHNGLGNALEDEKDLDGAMREYQKAIDLDPKSAEPHYNLGNVLYTKENLDGAIQEYQKAIGLDPKHAKAHSNLGNALHGKKDLDGAIQAFDKAIELDPKLPQPHIGLGNALTTRGDLDGANQEYRKAIDLDSKIAQPYGGLGRALLRQGRFAEARQATLQAARRSAAGHPLHIVVQDQLRRCELLLALDQKLAAIQQGQDRPADALELLALADLCQTYKKHNAAAAEFYGAAFAAAPDLVVDPNKPFRFNAACAAALAAAGRGKDASKMDAPTKAKWRQQALTWLRAELQARQKELQSGFLEANPARTALQHWQTDSDLAGVRDAKALAQLPEAERQDWQALWADVAQAVQKAKN
jgi:serine/threonine protein kinase/Flp pilus assembly protein TadD